MPDVIQWFPGHMTKTFRLIEKELRNVDIIIELLDARIPLSSKNPKLAEVISGKPCLLLINKSDLASPDATARWISYYKMHGYGAIAISSKDRKSGQKCVAAAKEVLSEKLEAQARKGITNPKIRAMVVGIPNVGKSTFINCIAGSARARAEDRPGVTRGKQWISVKEMDMLDMPGLLWPKFEDQNTARLLAFTGAIKDDVLDVVDVAASLLGLLKENYGDALRERYKITDDFPENNYDLLETIAKKRGMLLSKNEYDLERAATMLLDELRAGKLGRLTFELPHIKT